MVDLKPFGGFPEMSPQQCRVLKELDSRKLQRKPIQAPRWAQSWRFHHDQIQTPKKRPWTSTLPVFGLLGYQIDPNPEQEVLCLNSVWGALGYQIQTQEEEVLGLNPSLLGPEPRKES